MPIVTKAYVRDIGKSICARKDRYLTKFNPFKSQSSILRMDVELDPRQLPLLPVELLEKIFLYWRDIDPPDFSSSHENEGESRGQNAHFCLGWLKVLYIRRWREIALNYPALWTNIPDAGVEWVTAMLRHSRNRPLFFTIDMTAHPRSEALTTLLENRFTSSTRARVLTIDSHTAWTMAKRRVHGDRFPTLEELEIFKSEKHKTRSLNTVHIVTNVFSDAPPPSLRTLVLRDVLYLSNPSFLRNLAHVDIYNDLDHDFNLSWSMMTFRPMLEGMRHLEFLRLANAFPLTITAHEAAVMHEFEPIRLPSSLRDLVLVGPALSTEHFIACLDIPRTTRVDVRLAADQTHVYASGDPDPYASELFLPLDTLRSLNGPRAPRRVAVTVDGGVPELGLRLWGESAVGKDILDETSADVALVLRGKDQVFDIGTVSRMEQGLSDALELDAVTELVCLGRREDPADPTTSGHREDWFGLLHLVPNVRLVCTRSPLSAIYILTWLSAGAAVLCPALETLVLVDALGADEGMRRKTLAFVSTCVGDRKRAGKPLKKVQIGVRDRGRVISRWEAKELSSIRKLGVEIEIVVCEAAEEG